LAEPERGVHPLSLDKAVEYFKQYTVLRLVRLPEVETKPVAAKMPGQHTLGNITDSSAILSGFVKASGESDILSRGMCWSTNTKKAPTVFGNKTVDSAGLGAFSSSLQHLLAGTKYVARAYAINHTDTAYGEPVVFNTDGKMDTLGTLLLHGRWRCGKGNWEEDVLGQMQTDLVDACPGIVYALQRGAVACRGRHRRPEQRPDGP